MKVAQAISRALVSEGVTLAAPIAPRTIDVESDLEAMKAATGFTAGASDPRGITHTGHRDQLADFLRAIGSGGLPLVDGREGRKSVEIIRAIYRSAQTGQAVRLPLDDA